jgi:N-acetylglucosaminyldiphosphoundecaprenol N-acetyl-beta-D-mannosaminyltransferase
MGVSVHELTIQDMKALICDAVVNNERRIFANHNLHSIYLYYHDLKMRSFYANSDYIHIDGMPLVLLGKLFGYSLTKENRLTCIDWAPTILSHAAQKGWRIFYLGSKPGIVEQGAAVFKSKFPKLHITTYTGYFNAGLESVENQQVVEMINKYNPQILMVGMGMPRQEHWIVDNFKQLHTNVIINVGAYIDYIAGAIPTPPRWMGRIGLEWLYRLISEPRRLWRRYLVEPWFLAKLIKQDVIRRLGGETRYGA